MAVHELVAEHDAEVIGKPDWTFSRTRPTRSPRSTSPMTPRFHIAGDRMVGWDSTQRKA